MLKPCSLPDSPRPILTKAGKQRGAATLVVAIILLLALTIVTFSAARIGVSEQRTSVNDMRNKEAMDVALAGLEHGLAYLERNRPKINSTSTTAPVGWMQPGSVRWTACGVSTATLPCGDGASSNIYGPMNPQVGGRDGNWLAYSSVDDVEAVQMLPVSKYRYDVSYLTPGFDIDSGPGVTLGPDNNPIIIIVSTATATPDATGAIDALAGSATARMTVRGYSTLMNIPAAPLMAQGTVGGAVTSGGNPTGNLSPLSGIPPSCSTATATQNPVSVITPETGSPPPPSSGSPSMICGVGGVSSTTITTVTGNTMTTLTTWGTTAPPTWVGGATRISAYLPGVQCNEPFPGDPLPSNPPACPPPIVVTDLFKYVFGVPDTKFQIIKNEFTPITTCSGLPTQPAGRYWITGACTLTSGTVGTVNEPVILVVEDGDLMISGSSEFYGLIYVRDPNDNRTITLTGSADLYGALVSDRDIGIGGSFDVHYDYGVLRKAGSTSGGGFSKVTGGWRDQLQP